MSDTSPEQEAARPKRLGVGLDSLYLDPNNFRFIDHKDYRRVGPKHLFEDDIQRRTTRFILGRGQENVSDLVASIQESNWLETDPILVRRESRGRYLVVDGNRRVATLKHLKRRYEEDAADIGNLDPAIFRKVSVVVYEDADEQHHLVMTGLHHISGERRWPAINRAEAMRRLYELTGQDAGAVCRALGVSKIEFNLSLRTLALVEQYKNSDYGDQFRRAHYNLFREVLRSPAIRKWLSWDQNTRVAANATAWSWRNCAE